MRAYLAQTQEEKEGQTEQDKPDRCPCQDDGAAAAFDGLAPLALVHCGTNCHAQTDSNGDPQPQAVQDQAEGDAEPGPNSDPNSDHGTWRLVGSSVT
jgi:hypothetical protein